MLTLADSLSLEDSVVSVKRNASRSFAYRIASRNVATQILESFCFAQSSAPVIAEIAVGEYVALPFDSP